MTEREWREASDMRQATLSLAAILVLAGTLRFVGLGAAPAHGEETAILERVLSMMREGSLHPRSFEIPSLYVYLQFAASIVRFLAGATAGEWESLDEISPAHLYTWSRGISALLGTLTPLLVYLIGLRWGTRSALLGAGLMAVVPLHVRQSQMAVVGVPLTFLVALTFLLAQRTQETPRSSTAAAGGAAAGLAAATAYSGAIALVLPLVAVWMTPAIRPSRLIAALLACAAALGTFLLATPYAVVDLPGFLNGYAGAMSAAGASAPFAASIGGLRSNFGLPAFLLMVGGSVLALVRAVRGPGRVRWTLALSFPIVYLTLTAPQAETASPSLLPLFPFLCILAATAVVSGVSLLRRFSIPRALRTALIVALTVATLLPPLVASVRLNRRAHPEGGPARPAPAVVETPRGPADSAGPGAAR